MSYYYLPPITTFTGTSSQNNGVPPVNLNEQLFDQLVKRSGAQIKHNISTNSLSELATRVLPLPTQHLPPLASVIHNSQPLQEQVSQPPLASSSSQRTITFAPIQTGRYPKNSRKAYKPVQEPSQPAPSQTSTAQTSTLQTPSYKIREDILKIYKTSNKSHLLVVKNIEEILEKLNNEHKIQEIHDFLKQKGFEYTPETLSEILKDLTTLKACKHSRNSELADIKPKNSENLRKVKTKTPTRARTVMITFMKAALYNYKLNNMNEYKLSNLKFAFSNNCDHKMTHKLYKKYLKSGQELEVFGASQKAYVLEALFTTLTPEN